MPLPCRSSVVDKEKILFVFEGEKTEAQIISAVESIDLLLPQDKAVVISCFCGEIYQLFRNMQQDEYLEIFALLQEKPVNSNLSNHSRDDFSSVYLFFDYDPHANNGMDAKGKAQSIKEMLDWFNNETENGKLFISYPMIEAVKDASPHCQDLNRFLEFNIERERCRYFKAHMSNLCSQSSDIRKYTREQWQRLFNFHCIKANYLVREIKAFPNTPIMQSELFGAIEILPHIPVLSAIPMMLCEFYGTAVFKKKVELTEC